MDKKIEVAERIISIATGLLTLWIALKSKKQKPKNRKKPKRQKRK